MATERTERFMLMVKQLNAIIEKGANNKLNKLKQLDVTINQLRVIGFMYNNKKIYSLKELEKIFHSSQQAMARIVNRLEEKKLVKKVEEVKDKRVKKIQVTKEGEKLASQATEEITQMEKNLMDCLTEEEKNTVILLLKKIYNNAEEKSLGQIKI